MQAEFSHMSAIQSFNSLFIRHETRVHCAAADTKYSKYKILNNPHSRL